MPHFKTGPIDLKHESYQPSHLRYVQWGACIFKVYSETNKGARNRVREYMGRTVTRFPYKPPAHAEPVRTSLREAYYASSIPEGTQPFTLFVDQDDPRRFTSNMLIKSGTSRQRVEIMEIVPHETVAPSPPLVPIALERRPFVNDAICSE